MPIDLMFCATVYQFRWTGAVFLFGPQSLEGFVMLISNHHHHYVPSVVNRSAVTTWALFPALSSVGCAGGHSNFCLGRKWQRSGWSAVAVK